MAKLWCLSILLFSLLMGSASCQLWDLGSSQDWLSGGPIYYTGPYYTSYSNIPSGQYTYAYPYIYTNVSAPSGFQKFFSIDYSQFYRMPAGSAPIVHITAPQKYEISGKQPTTLYFIGQKQAVPYYQYPTYAAYTGGNSLWIQGTTSWTQYATVPQGSALTILAITSTGGSGYLYEIRPDGQLAKNYYYFFPGYNQISFYTDTMGQHILLFSIGSQLSNGINIDVVGYSPTPYLLTGNQQPGYSPTTSQQSSSQQSSYTAPGGY